MPIDFSRKRAGLLIPAFALRRPGDMGIGDTEAVRQAVDFCIQTGVTVLQLLPINETGGDHSPYNAISSVALDPVYISVDTLCRVPAFQDWGITVGETDSTRPHDGPVDYATVKPLKRGIMRSIFEELGDLAQFPDYVRFAEEHREWLPAYTLYRTLLDEYDGDARWTQWHPEHASFERAGQWLAASPEAGRIGRTRDFYGFLQWIAFSQWEEVRSYADSKGVKLMGDIPFGVSRYSADVWAHRAIFDLEWSGGAPPESFFKGDPFVERWGQNWGIPLYHWDEVEKTGYAWWRQRVQVTCRVFHLFRIDHVLGFFRIYSFPWIPERNGEFALLNQEQARKLTGGELPHFQPHEDDTPEHQKINAAQGRRLLLKILEFAGANGVVAEDLGIVPPYVRPILQELGIPGFTIPIFERNESTWEFADPSGYSKINLITFATHDHMPLLSYYEDLVARWHGRDGDGSGAWQEVQRLMRLLGLDPQNPPLDFTPGLHRAFDRALMSSPCWLAVSMITDVLGTAQRFNEPGSSKDSNWSQRLDRPLDQFQSDPHFAPKLEMFRDLARESGR
ncbi:MAG: 4-alpha-glucanotransferase [Verrucomicrobiae bacterium]|nr:4-alpha-glucanotransferase [Verrucomicrobiae bacterium]